MPGVFFTVKHDSLCGNITQRGSGMRKQFLSEISLGPFFLQHVTAITPHGHAVCSSAPVAKCMLETKGVAASDHTSRKVSESSPKEHRILNFLVSVAYSHPVSFALQQGWLKTHFLTPVPAGKPADSVCGPGKDEDKSKSSWPAETTTVLTSCWHRSQWLNPSGIS